MNKIRWGLLSTANINKELMPAIRLSERGELTAVASRSLDSAEAYAAKWDIPLAFGSYDAMLQSDEIDAVYIGLPNHLHAPWTIKAMEQGKHVLCEKPFALTVEDVDVVSAVSERTSMVVMEAFMYRHHPQTKMAGRLIGEGRLGDIIAIQGAFSFKLMDNSNVRMIPELGGGSLWDVGCYPVSLSQYLMGGPPEWVFADQTIGETGAEVTILGQMRYPAGGIAQFTSSFQTPQYTVTVVQGTNGRLEILQPFRIDWDGSGLRFHALDGMVEEIEVPETDLYLGQVDDMHAAILDGAATYLSLEETRNHIRTLLALYESAATNRPVIL